LSKVFVPVPARLKKTELSLKKYSEYISEVKNSFHKSSAVFSPKMSKFVLQISEVLWNCKLFEKLLKRFL